MLTDRDVKDLIAFRPGKPVLSVYLNVDPSQGSADAYKLHLRQMLKPLVDQVPADAETVERFIEHEYDWSGKGIALFSCQQADFFRTHTFEVPLRSRARVLGYPYVKPLADLLDSYGNYGVALVDKQGARAFHFHLGSILQEQKITGEEVHQTKRGGGSQAAGRKGGLGGPQEQTRAVIGRNLREFANFTIRFFQEADANRVLIGGTDSNVAHFRELLPKLWQDRVVGTFPIEMQAKAHEVLERAMEVATEVEREREERLVKAVVTAAAKGQEGVVALDSTLGAVHAGQVQTLVVQEGFQAPGYQCSECHFMSAQQIDQCPFCGGRIERIEDAVELAVRQVMQAGGEVEIVHDSPDLERAGGIGGLLRY